MSLALRCTYNPVIKSSEIVNRMSVVTNMATNASTSVKPALPDIPGRGGAQNPWPGIGSRR
jgi:hypothetical protein